VLIDVTLDRQMSTPSFKPLEGLALVAKGVAAASTHLTSTLISAA
jgi:hypothetical protein